MPTGYTEAVKDGISFQEFAMRCVRAMGVCITLRDEPSGAPIPERFEPSPCYKDALKKSSEELNDFFHMTSEDITAANLAKYNEEVEYHTRRLKEVSELHAKYTAMLDQVRAWVPPREEHEGFKRFMIDQLRASIDQDCDTSYFTEPVRITDEQWIIEERKRLQRSLDYHTKHYEEEIERAAKRTLWMQQFRESIGL